MRRRPSRTKVVAVRVAPLSPSFGERLSPWVSIVAAVAVGIAAILVAAQANKIATEQNELVAAQNVTIASQQKLLEYQTALVATQTALMSAENSMTASSLQPAFDLVWESEPFERPGLSNVRQDVIKISSTGPAARAYSVTVNTVAGVGVGQDHASAVYSYVAAPGYFYDTTVGSGELLTRGNIGRSISDDVGLQQAIAKMWNESERSGDDTHVFIDLFHYIYVDYIDVLGMQRRAAYMFEPRNGEFLPMSAVEAAEAQASYTALVGQGAVLYTYDATATDVWDAWQNGANSASFQLVVPRVLGNDE